MFFSKTVPRFVIQTPSIGDSWSDVLKQPRGAVHAYQTVEQAVNVGNQVIDPAFSMRVVRVAEGEASRVVHTCRGELAGF